MAAKINYEAELQNQLDHAGYRYYREYRFDMERMWRADFYLYDFNLLVEVEGVMYSGRGRHQSAVGFQGDCEKYNTCQKMRFGLLRFTPKMVMGTATRGKNKIKMQSAIECINDFCLGSRTGKIDRDEGYAKRAMERWPPQREG